MNPIESVVSKEGQRVDPLSIDRSQALVEARRCLYCYRAPCIQACPVRIDIPSFIKRLAEENLRGSYELLVTPNPLAATCGLVCPTEDLCEGACVLSKMGQRPIRIGALQYHVASLFREPEPPVAADTGKQVAVIGGGPSGLGCAVVLRRRGHRVALYEQADELGGLVTQVIPAYRLPASVVEHDLARLDRLGIELHLATEVDAPRIERLRQERDALFLGVGLHAVPTLALPGVHLEGVTSALSFLRRARARDDGASPTPEVRGTVVVVGGGNVALDAAVVARQLGAERVIVLYRRTLEEMPAWRSEYMEAAAIGAEFRWLSLPSQILGQGGAVRAVKVQSMRRTDRGADGRRGVAPDPEAPSYALPCDQVLLALGQALDPTLAVALGLSLSEAGTIPVDPQTFQTQQPDIFAAGEALAGGSTVVASLAMGMAAGCSIDRYLAAEEG